MQTASLVTTQPRWMVRRAAMDRYARPSDAPETSHGLYAFFRGPTPPATAALQGPTVSHCGWPARFRLNLPGSFDELQWSDVPRQVTTRGPTVYLEAFFRRPTTTFERQMMSQRIWPAWFVLNLVGWFAGLAMDRYAKPSDAPGTSLELCNLLQRAHPSTHGRLARTVGVPMRMASLARTRPHRMVR